MGIGRTCQLHTERLEVMSSQFYPPIFMPAHIHFSLHVSITKVVKGHLQNLDYAVLFYNGGQRNVTYLKWLNTNMLYY